MGKQSVMMMTKMWEVGEEMRISGDRGRMLDNLVLGYVGKELVRRQGRTVDGRGR